MDIESPLLSLMKQGVLVAFVLSFTLTALTVWFSNLEEQGERALELDVREEADRG